MRERGVPFIDRRRSGLIRKRWLVGANLGMLGARGGLGHDEIMGEISGAVFRFRNLEYALEYAFSLCKLDFVNGLLNGPKTYVENITKPHKYFLQKEYLLWAKFPKSSNPSPAAARAHVWVVLHNVHIIYAKEYIPYILDLREAPQAQQVSNEALLLTRHRKNDKSIRKVQVNRMVAAKGKSNYFSYIRYTINKKISEIFVSRTPDTYDKRSTDCGDTLS
ncbi:predicted protein [Arabidopsis lyrata subsp. lyrata]|uniref:Predicted protein n=1 Tax=Arabidopsis lyrata subsp. lyrata TaxID=81972 RepID=D7LJ29_ARALL|nr:predicted protein [Arabidopsis lyrata subsp. lyrata]